MVPSRTTTTPTFSTPTRASSERIAGFINVGAWLSLLRIVARFDKKKQQAMKRVMIKCT